jgi:hypothetical protein
MCDAEITANHVALGIGASEMKVGISKSVHRCVRFEILIGERHVPVPSFHDLRRTHRDLHGIAGIATLVGVIATDIIRGRAGQYIAAIKGKVLKELSLKRDDHRIEVIHVEAAV